MKRGVSRATLISDGASLGENVLIGPHTIIYDNVSIGDNTVIGPNCCIGEPLNAFYEDDEYVNPPLIIGNNSLIRSGVTIYAGSDLGDYLEVYHGTVIRDETIMGDHCKIGINCVIQGHCTILDYVRIHSLVEVGLKSKIGNFVWLYPYSILLNDWNPPSNTLVGVTIEDFAIIGSHAILYPGITVGADSLIGAGSHVREDVPKESVMVGQPARRICHIWDVKLRNEHTRGYAYPWRFRFERGMPWEGIGYDQWMKDQK